MNICLYKSKKSTPAIFILLFLLIGVFFKGTAQPPIRVATAANLAQAVDSVAHLFEKESGTRVEIISGASGKLTAQIINGAPFHVFIAADMHYPNAVYEAGKASNAPFALVEGNLVFWSAKRFSGSSFWETLVPLTQQGKIALANPELAPYGTTARAILEEKNLWETLVPRVVYGENVGQVNRLIYTGTVTAAFTAASAQYAPQLRNIGYWYPLPEGKRIPHGVVLLRHSATHQAEAVQQFYTFLFSKQAQEIFQQFGYSSSTLR